MGSVWVADHLALATTVAVKFLAAAYAQNEAVIQRFRREAMAAAQINSPHVAQVFDHGVADGTPYIVMELLDGEDLHQRICRTGPLEPQVVASIVGQVAKALTRAHQLGIVHRDIKPANIFLIDVDGELFAKVLDFGVAKLKSDDPAMTSTGTIVGTPLYMSPEQLLSGKHVDFRSDLWSLGVVAYYTLTGRCPFAGETLGSLSVAVHAGVFAPPSTLRSGLAPAMDAWMARALCRDPGERFGSAKEMAEELRGAVGHPTAAAVGPLAATVVLPPEGALVDGAGSSDLSQAPGVAHLAPSKDGPAKTLSGTAASRSGSRGGKAAWLATLTACGLGAIGAAIWFFMRSHAPGPSESSEIHSPPASVPAASIPSSVAKEPAPAPPAVSQEVPTALSPGADAPLPSPPPAAASQRSGPRPNSPVKPQSTTKRPTHPTRKRDDIGF